MNATTKPHAPLFSPVAAVAPAAPVADEARPRAMAGLIGSSPCFTQLMERLRSLEAYPEANVLITGETGTGKELLARAIHFGSPLAKTPFTPVNCSTLVAGQAEILFRGAARSPGASPVPEPRGALDPVHGGTLFLDEIGDMPLEIQPYLLRLLDEGMGPDTAASAGNKDVRGRVIATTHADLAARVAEGTFRQDLYYRLMQVHLPVPPLRERMDDVPALARHFARTLASEQKLAPSRLRPEVIQRLLTHRYPGNIRELKNTIERALIHAGADTLRGTHIVFTPPAIPGNAVFAQSQSNAGPVPADLAGLPLNLAEAEDKLIARAITVAAGNLSLAARLLGINRASLYRWQQRRESPGSKPASGKG